jgi:hypothetical protein
MALVFYSMSIVNLNLWQLISKSLTGSTFRGSVKDFFSIKFVIFEP